MMGLAGNGGPGAETTGVTTATAARVTVGVVDEADETVAAGSGADTAGRVVCTGFTATAAACGAVVVLCATDCVFVLPAEEVGSDGPEPVGAAVSGEPVGALADSGPAGSDTAGSDVLP